MGHFNRDNRSGGRGDFRRRDFGDRGRDRQMHRAICSDCGQECEVPFKPSGDKPVFCSSCFEKNRGNSGPRRFGGERNSNPPQNNEQFNQLNAKLDKILAMLASVPFTKPAEEPKIELPLPSEKPTVIVKKKPRASKKATQFAEEK